MNNNFKTSDFKNIYVSNDTNNKIFIQKTNITFDKKSASKESYNK